MKAGSVETVALPQSYSMDAGLAQSRRKASAHKGAGRVASLAALNGAYEPAAMPGTSLSLAATHDAVWLRLGRSALRRIARLPWLSLNALPLSGAVIATSNEGAAIVIRRGRVLRFASRELSGTSVHLSRDRFFLFGGKIRSVVVDRLLD